MTIYSLDILLFLFGTSLLFMSSSNSDDHYIYYCGQESLRRNGVAIIADSLEKTLMLGKD